jgi:2,3-dihydroxyphenylpropionate 1,2-dioxygenase
MSMSMVCCSHSPLLLGSLEPADREARDGFFKGMKSAGEWLRSCDPELLVVFGPDHFTGLFYDMMPAFCIGAAATASRDWDLPPGELSVPGQIALDCHRFVSDAGFDPAISYRLTVDHGTTIPLHELVGSVDAFPVLPIVVNCVSVTRPSFKRVREFGAAVGRFLRGLDRRVVIIGSGGLSHDPPTPRLDMSAPEVVARLVDRHVATKKDFDARQARVVAAARAMVAGGGPCLPPNEAWDRAFLDRLLRQDLEAFDGYTDEMMDREAGFGGHEVRTWVAAAAAMQAAGPFKMTLDYYRIIPEWITGMAVVRGAATS